MQLCNPISKKESQITQSRFKQYKAWIENVTGSRIKLVRTDGGTEYKGGFSTLLTDSGLEHQTTAAYTSQQNGIVECWQIKLRQVQ